jgi:photosystem II stability/assembly factor-like uncharacterized protein
VKYFKICFWMMLFSCIACAAKARPDSIAQASVSVTTCSMLDGGAPVSGTWEQVTPAGIANAGAYVLDPSDSATVYLGTTNQGVWKSTDCGNTWVLISTGTNSNILNAHRQRTMVIDATGAIYTNTSGINGLWKSTNGGVDWTNVLTSGATLACGGDIEVITLDPTDSTHLLLSFHSKCNAPWTTGALAESHDSGASWSFTNAPQQWAEGDGQWMLNATTWFFADQFKGIWRTVDAGATWTHVMINKQAAAYNAFYASPTTGAIYAAGAGGGVHQSLDQGVTWTVMDGPHGSKSTSVVGTGSTLYLSYGPCFGGTPFLPYKSATETNPTTWNVMTTPMMQQGGRLVYDSNHTILYSSNCAAGFWRGWVGP